MSDILGGLVRAATAAAAGWLVKKGWTDAQNATTILGLVVGLGTAIWSVIKNKRHADEKK